MAESKSLRRAIQDSDCRSVDVCSREQTRILKSVTDAFTKALCDKRIVAEDFKVWIGEMKAISSKKENRRILIVGEAGDGKSTLLNTLLAQSVLRTGCAGSSETSNICEISYTGSSRSIVLDKFYVKETEWRDLMMSLDDARDIEIPDTEQNDQSTPAEELQDEWLRLKTLFYGSAARETLYAQLPPCEYLTTRFGRCDRTTNLEVSELVKIIDETVSRK